MGKVISPFVSKRSDTKIDEKEIGHIGEALGLHPKLVELLFYKGMTDQKAIKDFLYPSKESFLDPFLMKNMQSICDRIDEAISEGQKIVIFGDYDCDGVCSSAMLSLYLSTIGANVRCHIPNRDGGGYGLNVQSLERIIEEGSPDLIITCDCGISCIAEVEYTLDLGVDIIVTDHHEVGEQIPECLVLNPKQRDCEYPNDQLCGAGVVLKLIEAHAGRDRAAEYLGLAAIATIADLVPLTGENRLIVQLGLKYEDLKKNLGIKMLLDQIEIYDKVSSSDIAFKLAPRLNAAGRMGDAYRSFQLLISDNPQQISAIINEIELDNSQRKELCNKLYTEAIEIIAKEKMTANHAIIISHPDWEKGITGIVAARLSNEFLRPSFILVKSGDYYKGTARSISEINLYELLTSVKDILLEFGGHSQAAGFSISQENIPEFVRRVNLYLQNLPYVSFLVKVFYDLDIEPSEVNMDFMNAIDLLEPFGNGNNRPLFRLRANSLRVSNLKNTEHLCITLNDDINVYAFNYRKWSHIFRGEDTKELILDFKLNSFRNKTKIEAYVKTCVAPDYDVDADIIEANFIKYINFKEKETADFLEYQPDKISELIGDSIFGTLIIAGSKRSYEQFLLSDGTDHVVVREKVFAMNKNNYNRIIASPEFDDNLPLSGYNTLIFLDSPISKGVISYINKKTDAKIYIPQTDNALDYLEGVNLERETFAKYYNCIKENEHIAATDLYSYCKLCKAKDASFDTKQFVVCLSVFIDLNLIRIVKNDFGIKANRTAKVNLTDSKTYVYIKEKLSKTHG